MANGPNADDGCGCACCLIILLPAAAVAIGVAWKILQWFGVA